MKMIHGAGTVSNYGSYISNCTKNQFPYKVPVNSISDVQLYIDIGPKPDAIQIELIHTCGPLGGTIETLIAGSYVIGQDTHESWYGVFKNLSGGTNLSCFVIAITLSGVTDEIYFSEEYCVVTCGNSLTQIKGCYGNLNNKLSYDCEGSYFGVHDGEETPLGDITVKYEHKLLIRNAEVSLFAIKNSFKQFQFLYGAIKSRF